MVTRNFHWSSVFDCVMCETDGSDISQVVYTHEPTLYGSLISELRGVTEHFHHYDVLGSTTILTIGVGTVTDTFLYDAWGSSVTRAGTTPTPYQWLGRWGYQYDAPREMHYVRARAYEPMIARWASIDPLPAGASTSPYIYSSNLPVLLRDPSGLIPAAGNWKAKCNDPDGRQTAPDGEPKKGDACFYPGRKVCRTVGVWPFVFTGCWESQCVCQCVGDSPGLGCVRACIRCADDNGAPRNTIDAEQYCQNVVCKDVLTNKDLQKLNCCTQNNSNQGGCLGSNIAAPMNPNPGDKRCQKC